MTLAASTFLSEFSRALDRREAALFVGAGLSVGAGLVDWRGLLKDVATGLGLEIDEETDLIALAQYEQNASSTRHRLNAAIVEQFTIKAHPTKVHSLIAQLPFDLIWTTNYDSLLEDTLRAVDRSVDVKFRTSQLTFRRSNTDVTIYKMHGDASDADDAVITKDDYERYEVDREAFTELLRSDLVRHSFLFCGFSFTDPNIEYIMSRLRRMLKGTQRMHYCILRSPKRADKEATDQFERSRIRFEHRIADLKRFGIQSIVISDYAELESLFAELAFRSNTKNVLISGSNASDAPFTRDRLESLARRLGSELVSRGYKLVSGYGLGVGGAAILGAQEAATRQGVPLGDRLILRLFPQDIAPAPDRARVYRAIRSDMIAQSGAVIVLAGNKLGQHGNLETAPGVIEELDLARSSRKLVIPIGATGHVAATAWAALSTEWKKSGVRSELQHSLATLGGSSTTDDELVGAIFNILASAQELRA
jgi:hypothetical protein